MNCRSFNLAHSPLGLSIPIFHFMGPGPKVLILGGVHGDEVEGVMTAEKLLEGCLKSYTLKLNLFIAPRFNPEGILGRTRGNSRQVDLNRNLPTKDWSGNFENPRYNPGPRPLSEPENQGLVQWFEKENPSFVLSLHSWKPMHQINGDCLPEAEVLQKHTGYPIERDIGYPTPGSLGTYAGIERNIPTLTYEIERGSAWDFLLKLHPPAIYEMLKSYEKRMGI